MVALESNKRSIKFRERADSLQPKIDDKLAPRQTNTHRKIRMAETAEAEGKRLQVFQDKLLALADAWDSITVPDILAGITQPKQVEDLVTYNGFPANNETVVKRLHKARIHRENWNDAKAAIMQIGDPTIGQYTQADELRRLEREVAMRNIPGFFPTPEPVGQMMVGMLDDEHTKTILEPSAGRGDLADVARETYPVAQIDVCEINGDLRHILGLKNYNIVAWDFLKHGNQSAEAIKTDYDGVLMNPPFEKNEDVDHVMLAYQFLKPGGRLVAVMGEGVFFRENGKPKMFRNWLEQKGGTSIKLPENALNQGDKPSGVKARIVIIEKPDPLAFQDEPEQGNIDALVNFLQDDGAAPAIEAVKESGNNVIEDILAVLRDESPLATTTINNRILERTGHKYDVMFFSVTIRQMIKNGQVIDCDGMRVKLPEEQAAADNLATHEVETQPEIPPKDETPEDTEAQELRDRIAFVLSYSVTDITASRNALTKGGRMELLEARRQETEGKNRKSIHKWLDRRLKKLDEADDAERAQEGESQEPDEPQVSVEEEQRVADEAIMCERCKKHRALYMVGDQQVCTICNDNLLLKRQGPDEPASDPTPEVNGDQLPLLPETTPARPQSYNLPLSWLVHQVEHTSTPPQPFIDSVALVQLYAILVIKRGEKHILVDGRRRVKALQAWADQNEREYPTVHVRAEVFDGDSWTHDAVMAIKANAQRSPNVLNELEHIEDLISKGYTKKQIAEATGMRVQTIRKRLRLTQLTPDLRTALDEGRIKPGVAAKAVNLTTEQQNELATKERITGNDITDMRQVQIAELVDTLFPDEEPEVTPETVESGLSDVALHALIEGASGTLKQALIELRTFRTRYGVQPEAV